MLAERPVSTNVMLQSSMSRFSRRSSVPPRVRTKSFERA